MKHSELIRRTATKAGMAQAEVKRALDSFTAIVKEVLKSEGEVPINGIGKIVKKIRPARTGVNPFTKKKFSMPETATATLKVAKELRDHLNS